MKVLFICKYNRFRSKVAESIFNKLNKNLENEAKSAGLVGGLPISDNIIKVCKEEGLEVKNPPRGLTHQLNMWADKIIIIEDRVSPDIFDEERVNDGKEIIQWKIKDTRKGDSDIREKRVKLIEEIRGKVEELLE